MLNLLKRRVQYYFFVQRGLFWCGTHVVLLVVHRANDEIEKVRKTQEAEIARVYQESPELQMQLQAPILEDKVVDFILELAQVEDRSVSRRWVLAGGLWAAILGPVLYVGWASGRDPATGVVHYERGLDFTGMDVFAVEVSDYRDTARATEFSIDVGSLNEYDFFNLPIWVVILTL